MMIFKPIILDSLREYNRKLLLNDLWAGISVGFLALPLAMVFAIACNLPPERGLFTAIVAGFLAAVFGGSRVQVTGPTGAFVLLISGIAAQFGYAGLVYCTLLAALILIIMGLTKMGSLVKFIPFPVTTGFTTGIAVVIFSTQIKDLLGLKIENVPTDFIPKWASYFQNIGSISISATAIAILTIAVIIVLKRKFPKWPAILISMVIATIVAQVLGLPVETISSRFGDLPHTLPAPVAAIVHAAVLALILLILGPFAKMVPMAALAGILVVVSYNMSEIWRFFGMFKAPKSDWSVLLLTFILTVFVDLIVAVEVGLLLSAAMFIKRMADVTNIGVVTRELRDMPDSAKDDPNSIANREVPEGVGVFEINGPFFFGAVEKFKDHMQILNQPLQVVILRIRQVPAIDASGLHVIEDLMLRCRKKGTVLIISGIHTQPLFAMQKSGLLDEIGAGNVVSNIDTALNRARTIMGLPQVTPVNPANIQTVPDVAAAKRPEAAAAENTAAS